MQNPLRLRNRVLTPEQTEEVQRLVFELVRERLMDAFGENGMYTVGMKDPRVVDSVFSATVAESLAWDVAAELAAPARNSYQAAPVGLPIQTPAGAQMPGVQPRTFHEQLVA